MYRGGPRFTPLFDLPVCSAGVVDFATSNKKSGAVQFESETLRTAVASVRFHYSTFDSALFLSSMLWWQRWGGGVGDVVELLFFPAPSPPSSHPPPPTPADGHARGTADTARIEDRHFEKRHLDVQMYAHGSRGGHWDPPEEVVDIERSR